MKTGACRLVASLLIGSWTCAALLAADPIPGIGPKGEVRKLHGELQFTEGPTSDGHGNLYITSGLGIQVYDPHGQLLGILSFPEQPANCTFGGPGNHTLYVTARTSLYAVDMEAEGHVFPGKAE